MICSKVSVVRITLIIGSAILLPGCNTEIHGDNIVPANQPAVAAPPVPIAPAAKLPSEADLGVPLYPGAKPYILADGGTIDQSTTMSGITSTMLQTPDSFDTVAAFYRSKMVAADPNDPISVPTEREETRDGKKVLSISQIVGTNDTHNVQIRQDDKMTIIQIMRMKVEAATTTGSSLPVMGAAGEATPPADVPSDSLAPAAGTQESIKTPRTNKSKPSLPSGKTP